MMREDETSISYNAARKIGMAQKVKNAWKKEVSRRRVSRQTLAMCLRDWRKGNHELIVDKDLIAKKLLLIRKSPEELRESNRFC